ncbi:hypothetical protein AV545_16625 [Paenibacillus jamilae]|nr:hypothetical protein AV545_16625 [Paenibacillus jamilae]
MPINSAFLCEDLPHSGVLFVHCAFTDDKSQDAFRPEQVQRTDKKVIVNVVAAGVAAVMDTDIMKRDIGEYGNKALFAPVRISP